MKIEILKPEELKNNLWVVDKLSYNLYPGNYKTSPILIWKKVQLARNYKNRTCEVVSECHYVTAEELIKMIDLIKETNTMCKKHKRDYYYSLIF